MNTSTMPQTAATTSSSNPIPGNPNISWPSERPMDASRTPDDNNNNNDSDSDDDYEYTLPPTLDISNLPRGKKSLSGIAVRAHFIGLTLGLSLSAALYARVHLATALWRVPFFLASLCLFHFLEFYTTARYNTRQATISAFLLSANGWAYNVAHGSAVVECLVSHYLYPQSGSGSGGASSLLLVLGLVGMAVGQGIRSLAMAQAASNFNHNVQVERKEGHELVRHGVYGVLRHPSYFGFFWWGLGTQLMLGNVVCLAGYAVVLWRFFYKRIHREEFFLVAFFGDEYVDYRKHTRVGIPFI